VLVVARLPRHQRDRVGRHVRRVCDDDVHLSAETGGEHVVEVALEDAFRRQVAPGAGHRVRVHVDGPDLDTRHSRQHRRRDGAGPAAQVDDHIARRHERDDGLDQQRGALARHEHTRRHGQPQPAELHPPEQLLQRLAGLAAYDERVELLGGRCRVGQQRCLVLGEDAPGRPQPRQQAVELVRGRVHAPDPRGGSARIRTTASRSTWTRASW
jgi:hypothetical protein